MKKFGWRPDLKDLRDYRPDQVPWAYSAVKKAPHPAVTSIPTTIPIFDQGDLGSCTANAVLRLYAHDEMRRTGRYTPLSRLFLYKATRDRLGWGGDCGATIRDTMKSLVLMGCALEKTWPYKESKFDQVPNWIACSEANSFQALRYIRLKSLEEIKAYIRAGFPVAFGFTCYESIDRVGSDGIIKFPEKGENVADGHAIVAEGYRDNLGQGYLRVANSWGETWGERGFGWLPYQYFESGLCDDFWTLLWAEHPEIDQFD